MKAVRLFTLVVIIFALILTTACASTNKTDSKMSQDSNKEAPKKVDFPTKDITWIVPVSTGGQYDNISRVSAEFFKKYLPKNVSIIVKNIPGADWALGLGNLVKSKPDGYTVSVFNLPANAINQIKGDAPYDLHKIEWIGRLTSYPLVGVVKKGSKLTKIDDFINAKGLKFGTVGLTSGTGLSLIDTFESFAIQNGKMIEHNGTSESITALLRGDIDYTAVSLGSSYDLIKKGDLVPLWVMSEQRMDLLPDVPSIKELGYPQLIISSNPHTTLGLPPGTPQEIVNIWKEAFDKVVKDPEYNKKLVENLKTPVLPADSKSEKTFVEDGFKSMEAILKKASKYE